jgi:hypothetical protein
VGGVGQRQWPAGLDGDGKGHCDQLPFGGGAAPGDLVGRRSTLACQHCTQAAGALRPSGSVSVRVSGCPFPLHCSVKVTLSPESTPAGWVRLVSCGKDSPQTTVRVGRPTAFQLPSSEVVKNLPL